MKQTYTSGCQYGRARYEADVELGEVRARNCSRCGEIGSVCAFEIKKIDGWSY